MINAIEDYTEKDKVQEQYNLLWLNKFKESCPETYLKKQKVHPLMLWFYAVIVTGWIVEIAIAICHG
jgi:hypothetical protein